MLKEDTPKYYNFILKDESWLTKCDKIHHQSAHLLS